MAIELKQQVRLSQQLVMTPQLQQAIKLLQLNRLELQTLVQQELEENPVLEETLDQEDPTPGELSDETPDYDLPEAATSAEVAELTSAVSEPEPAVSADEPTDAVKMDDIDWENYLNSNPQTGLDSIRSGDESDRPSLEATLSGKQTLTDHLEWQLHLADFAKDEAACAEWVIGNIDDDGYLRSTTEELARQSGADEELIERTIAKVQGFDPTGGGARDLRECLMLQMSALDFDDELVFAIVNEHIDLLRKRDFRGIVKAIGVTIEEVAAAAKVIGMLEPWPGRAYGGDEPVYITPDIYLHKIGDEFHVMLNEDGLPKLRINNMYRDVLARGNNVEKDTKEYVHEKVRAAMWLIKSIHQRQRTIYKVMDSIVTHQREFFEGGVQFLKPLNLRDVADDIGMHESTVSRVTTNKYVHTPQGIFELKYFFNSGVGRFGGDSVSSETVKQKIRNIISNEDPRRPLSDQRIAEMLKVADIDIARRTVTKYREAMNVLSSTKRREIG
ncbi:MAG: RNA polymerase factor sigma-54 [Myxococcota bacterium]|nr:RNA polymerase factor sigma-54 [Myxococcota bacterium]